MPGPLRPSLLHLRHVLKPMIDRQPSLLCQANIVVGSFGISWKPEDHIAALEKTIGGRIENLVVKFVAELCSACRSPDRKCDPFADDRYVSSSEQRLRGLLKAAQVIRHLLRVVSGSGSIWAGNQDQHGARSLFSVGWGEY